MNMKKIYFLFIIILVLNSCKQQSIKNFIDEEVLGMIYKSADFSYESYENLKYLTENYNKRLACYAEGIEAAKWAKGVMDKMNLNNVYLQEAKVMNWTRGDVEVGYIRDGKDTLSVNVCALGRGIATPEKGIEAEVVEVNGLDDLANFTKKDIEGKIIFFNQAMNPELKNTFKAYGEAAGQRFMGPIIAAQYGAVGTVIRSLTTSIDEFPHTGTTRKAENEATVPAVCIATKHANLLSEKLKSDPKLKFYFKTNCQNLPDTISYNAIGELTGTQFPNEFIVIGGHLDSWDNSPGAHDDGGGCMQAMEVLRIFKEIGYTPKHSIRAIMYMDEEISQGGGKAYAEEAKQKGEIHIAAIESDRGVTMPDGFTIDASPEKIAKIKAWEELFKPYNITVFEAGGAGVDIAPLKEQGVVLMALSIDPTHYFDWHHSGNDTFDQVNRDEMQKGAATIASLVYLIDKYGLE